MTTTTGTTALVYTTSTWTAQDEAAARQAAEMAEFDHAAESGQFYYQDADWCAICARPTDHFGEHTPEQIAAWKDGAR